MLILHAAETPIYTYIHINKNVTGSFILNLKSQFEILTHNVLFEYVFLKNTYIYLIIQMSQ